MILENESEPSTYEEVKKKVKVDPNKNISNNGDGSQQWEKKNQKIIRLTIKEKDNFSSQMY